MRFSFALLAVVALAFAPAPALSAEATCVCEQTNQFYCPTTVQVWWHQLDISAGTNAYGHLSYYFWEDTDQSYTNDMNQVTDPSATSFILHNFMEKTDSSVQLGAWFYMGDIAMKNTDQLPSLDEVIALGGDVDTWSQLNFGIVNDLLDAAYDGVTYDGTYYAPGIEEVFARENLQDQTEGYFTDTYNTKCGRCYYGLFVDAHKEADIGDFQSDSAEAIYPGQDTALAYTVFQNGDDYHRGVKEVNCTGDSYEPIITDGYVLKYSSLNSDTLPTDEATPPVITDPNGDSTGEGIQAFDASDNYFCSEEQYYKYDDVEVTGTTKLWESPDAGHMYIHYHCLPDQANTCTPPNSPPPPPPEGSVSGDPHFIGFNGVAFDYHGQQGAAFNLISTPTFTLNGLLGPDLRQGLTYLIATSLQTADGHHVQASAASGSLVVLVDDIPVETGDAYESGPVRADRSVSDSSRFVTIHTPFIELDITLHGDQFLDVSRVVLRKRPAAIAGVLGDTAQPGNKASYSHDDSFYFVTDLWATDFEDNVFGVHADVVDAHVKKHMAAVTAQLLNHDIVSHDAVVSNFQSSTVDSEDEEEEE